MREKLKEIAQQECVTASQNQNVEPQVIQKAVSTRLWRLMQRRLRDPSAGKKLTPIQTADTALPSSEMDEEADNILSFEQENERHTYSQSEDILELNDEEDEEDLLEVEHESEWEDLFTEPEIDDPPVDYDMLDYLHDGQHDGHHEISAGFLEDEVSSVFEDMLEL